MIPIVMVTGFLGSGKTTLLKRLAENRRDESIAFLVNDFSRIDVDGKQLQAMTENVVAIPGGSIFCRCLAGDFIKTLSAIPERFGTSGRPVEAVIVEASGVADPTVTDTLLSETGLAKTFGLRRVITVIDPGSFPKLLATLPTIRRQVQAADTVIINKSDVFSTEQMAEMESSVRTLNPGADVHRAAYCDVDIPWLAHPAARERPEGEMALCRDPAYERFDVGADGVELPLEEMDRALRTLGDGLYRVKGDVRTTDGIRHVEGRLDTIEWTVPGDEPAPSQLGLAVIVAASHGKQAEELLASLR